MARVKEGKRGNALPQKKIQNFFQAVLTSAARCYGKPLLRPLPVIGFPPGVWAFSCMTPVRIFSCLAAFPSFPWHSQLTQNSHKYPHNTLITLLGLLPRFLLPLCVAGLLRFFSAAPPSPFRGASLKYSKPQRHCNRQTVLQCAKS